MKPLQLSFRKAGRPQALLDFGFRQLDLESIPRRPDGLVFPHELIDPLLGRADGVKTKTLRALQRAEFAEQGENRGPRQVEGLRGQFVIRFQRQGALGEPLPDGVVIRGLKMQGPAQRLGMIDDLNIDGSGGGVIGRLIARLGGRLRAGVGDLFLELRGTGDDAVELGNHRRISPGLRGRDVHFQKLRISVLDRLERGLATLFVLLRGLDAFADGNKFGRDLVAARWIVENLDQRFIGGALGFIVEFDFDVSIATSWLWRGRCEVNAQPDGQGFRDVRRFFAQN